jgi:hypothetical protein
MEYAFFAPARDEKRLEDFEIGDAGATGAARRPFLGKSGTPLADSV